MKRVAVAAAVAAVVAGGLAVRARAGTIDLTQAALDTLTPIESSASEDELTLVIGGGSDSAAASTAVATLVAIAGDTTVDAGVRVRAIRDLGLYPAQSAAHQALVDQLQAGPTTPSRGTPVVLLRAAIEAFGSLGALGGGQSGDAAILEPLLVHASPDIRATTGRALGNLCDPGAIQPLRNQFGQESVGFVRFAITEALRVLGSCGT